MRLPNIPPGVESALILGGLAVFALLPALPGVPLCPIRLLAGVDCPTCGLTRALFAAMHGHWTEAAGWNPAVFVVLAVLLRRLVLLNLEALRRGWLAGQRVERSLLASFFALSIGNVFWG